MSYKEIASKLAMNELAVKGDLNKDALEDIVLIIKGTDKSKIIEDENRGKLDRNRRGIIVLLNKGNYYQLAAENYDCFSSENEDGGVYFAAELNVEIKKGNLHNQLWSREIRKLELYI